MARTKKAVAAGRRKPIDISSLQERARAIETASRAVKGTTIRMPLGVYEALVEQMEHHRAKQHDVLVRAVALGLEALRAGEPLDGLAPRQYAPWPGYDRAPVAEERLRGRRGAPAQDAIADALEAATPENPLFTLPGINGRAGAPRRPMGQAPPIPGLDEEIGTPVLPTGEPPDGGTPDA